MALLVVLLDAAHLLDQFFVFQFGRELVDLTKANQLAAELEDEELIEKMRRIEQDYQERHAAS